MPGKRPLRRYQKAIGRLGESIAKTCFSQLVAGRPLFRAIDFANDYPFIDFFVEILDREETAIGFLFVQVKSTSTAAIDDTALRVRIDLNKCNALAAIPTPTYLVVVDTNNEEVYFEAALRPKSKSFSSITKDFDLKNDAIRVRLHKEVVRFWRAKRSRVRKTSEFKNER